MKVVQFLVKEVNQFPSDIECMRYIATITDKVSVTMREKSLSNFFRKKYEWEILNYSESKCSLMCMSDSEFSYLFEYET